jgi:outer membrane biosynthesis protein TonB
MIKKISLFLFLIISIATYSQESELLSETNDVNAPDVIKPMFNGGGIAKFYEFVNQEFNFSKISKSGTIVVSFSINTLGEIKNIRVIDFSDVESATEIIRVIQKAPKWEPAKRAGEAFEVKMKMPFKFTVKESRKQEPEKTTENTFSTANGIENKPKFAGGLVRFQEFIAKNYRTPDVEGLRGKVIVSFVVEKDGSIVDVKVIKDLGYGTGAEAIRVLKLSPKWTPAMQDGKPVRVMYSLPIMIQATR